MNDAKDGYDILGLGVAVNNDIGRRKDKPDVPAQGLAQHAACWKVGQAVKGGVKAIIVFPGDTRPGLVGKIIKNFDHIAVRFKAGEDDGHA